jgi:hypothetical protein
MNIQPITTSNTQPPIVIYRGKESKKEFIKRLAQGILLFVPMPSATLIVHEYSHLLAMKAIFENVNPTVHFNFCLNFFNLSGYTRWGGTPALPPNSLITHETGLGLVYAAGPGSGIAVVALSSIAALKIHRRNASLAIALAMNAVWTTYKSLNICFFSLGFYNDYEAIEDNLGIPQGIQCITLYAIFLFLLPFTTLLFSSLNRGVEDDVLMKAKKLRYANSLSEQLPKVIIEH